MSASSVVVQDTGLGIALQVVVAGILHNLSSADLVRREIVIMIVIMIVLLDAMMLEIVWKAEMGLGLVIATALKGIHLLVIVLEAIDMWTDTLKMDMVGIGIMKGMEALEAVIGMLLEDQPAMTKETTEKGLTLMMLLEEACGVDIFVASAQQVLCKPLFV